MLPHIDVQACLINGKACGIFCSLETSLVVSSGIEWLPCFLCCPQKRASLVVPFLVLASYSIHWATPLLPAGVSGPGFITWQPS